MWEIPVPGTEFPRIFCPKTGPLQLGVVLGLRNHMICTYTGFIVDAIGVVVLPTL